MKTTKPRSSARIGLAIITLLALTTIPSSSKACTPGENHCLPTAEQCADGTHTGFWDGGMVGFAGVCIAGGGHTVVYAAGDPLVPCGGIVVADQTLSEADPNECAYPIAPPDQRTYVTMSDGTELALLIDFPAGWNGERLPAMFLYDGYDGGGGRSVSVGGMFNTEGRYVVVHAGVRGAGCSGGRFALFSQQSAADGAALVEWIAQQSWSDGAVGIFGHSYSGLMGLWVAAQRPPHLRAVTVSGVTDDLYRDLVYPGGMANSGFPIEWLAVDRPLIEHRYGTIRATREYDARCAEHVAGRPHEDPSESPYTPALLAPEDGDWWFHHSLRSVIGQVDVPTQIQGQFQDEQTHPRGAAVLWQSLAVTQKQLLLTNGDHSTWIFGHGDNDYLGAYTPDLDLLTARREWLDHYVRGVANGIDAQPRVRVLLESQPSASQHRIVHSGEIDSDGFPLSGTVWTKLYANGAGELANEAPTAQAGSDVYLNGSPRHIVDPGSLGSDNGTFGGQEVFWTEGTDAIAYRSAPASTTRAVAGPLEATLYAKIYAADAEFMVQVAEEDSTGHLSLLQRGFLKASHRALNASHSWFDGGTMYRPWHPHTNPELVTPGEPVRLDVEIWPVAFVLRPGHRLVMIVTSPPPQAGLDTYQPRSGVQVVEIMHDASHPTSLLVPFVPVPSALGPEPACGAQVSVFCS